MEHLISPSGPQGKRDIPLLLEMSGSTATEPRSGRGEDSLKLLTECLRQDGQGHAPSIGHRSAESPGLCNQRGASGRLCLSAWLLPASEAKACGISGSQRNVERTMPLLPFLGGETKARGGDVTCPRMYTSLCWPQD